jgi:hypothetical protein
MGSSSGLSSIARFYRSGAMLEIQNHAGNKAGRLLKRFSSCGLGQAGYFTV